MTNHRLHWAQESSFEGWACTACAWALHSVDESKTPLDDIQKAFDSHRCADYPRIAHSSEDLIKRAAWILRVTRKAGQPEDSAKNFQPGRPGSI